MRATDRHTGRSKTARVGKKERKKSETSMTTSVLKKQKVQENAVYYDITQHANFWGNPLFRTTKQHLNNSETTKSETQDTYLLLVELFCYDVLMSSVWKHFSDTI